MLTPSQIICHLRPLYKRTHVLTRKQTRALFCEALVISMSLLLAYGSDLTLLFASWPLHANILALAAHHLPNLVKQALVCSIAGSGVFLSNVRKRP